MVVPTLIVFGIGCVAGIACWIIAGSWVTAVAVVGVTVLASVWTFSFSLPASVGWTPTPHRRRRQPSSSSLPPLGTNMAFPSDHVRRGPLGVVGPIGAPYWQCSVSTPEGHFVIFTAGGLTGRGLGYTDVGAATFPDQCSTPDRGMVDVHPGFQWN